MAQSSTERSRKRRIAIKRDPDHKMFGFVIKTVIIPPTQNALKRLRRLERRLQTE